MRAAPLLLVDPDGVDVPGAGPDWILRRAEDGISAAQLWCPRCLGATPDVLSGGERGSLRNAPSKQPTRCLNSPPDASLTWHAAQEVLWVRFPVNAVEQPPQKALDPAFPPMSIGPLHDVQAAPPCLPKLFFLVLLHLFQP